MRPKNVFLLLCLTLTSSAVGQECTEYYEPIWSNDYSHPFLGGGLNHELRAGDEMWIEFSLDCFKIREEFFRTEDLHPSARWLDISQSPNDGVPARVLAKNGNVLQLESVLEELGGGRYRSTITLPDLLGRETQATLGDRFRVGNGDILYANWGIYFDGAVGRDFLAIVGPENERSIGFRLVPEPCGYVMLSSITLILGQLRRRRPSVTG